MAGVLVLAARDTAHVVESMFSAEIGKLVDVKATEGVVARSHCDMMLDRGLGSIGKIA